MTTMRLAYACSWWRPSDTTWSGSSAGLMNALAARPDVDITPVDAQHGTLTAAGLAAVGRIRGYGNWKLSSVSRKLTDARVRRRVRGLGVDAVVGVGDIETLTDHPTFLFQDANFSVLQAHRDVLLEHAPELVTLPGRRLDELVAEQRSRYASAAGVLSFSQWFADWLVEHDGVDPDRVHVVGGGFHRSPAPRSLESRGPGGTRVLFIGRDFRRKGGDLVVSAVEMLRSSGSGDFTLTVVGPARWPLSTAPPDWVDFRGEVPAHQVSNMWADHDLFAMPTWYEPYGLVFVEARAAGVPALGRSAFCMPELVPPTAGRLIPAGGGATEVAEELLAMSRDADLFASAAAESASVRADGGWSAVAGRVVSGVRSGLSRRAAGDVRGG